MGATVLVIAGVLSLFGYLSLGLFSTVPAPLPLLFLFAFAMSFSSTVFAGKVLDEKGEGESFYGRIAIGILIVQDLVAVAFLALVDKQVPSLWALLLLGLIPLRPVLNRIMVRTGHGELLILFGLTLALGGAAIFELAGVKGDLGALILGLLLSPYKKAAELARHLLGFKDLFLVGFFLLIGLSGGLTGPVLGLAALLAILCCSRRPSFSACSRPSDCGLGPRFLPPSAWRTTASLD